MPTRGSAGGSSSIDQISTLKRTYQRFAELTKAPLFSLSNKMLPVSMSRRRTRHLPLVRGGSEMRAPRLKSKRMPSGPYSTGVAAAGGYGDLTGSFGAAETVAGSLALVVTSVTSGALGISSPSVAP